MRKVNSGARSVCRIGIMAATVECAKRVLMALPKIEAGLKEGNVVLDGLYSWSEYKYLREKLGDRLVILAMVTGAGVRKARLANRPVRPLTAAEVDSRDHSEIENLEKGGPIAIADYYIDNNGDFEALKTQYEALKKNWN